MTKRMYLISVAFIILASPIFGQNSELYLTPTSIVPNTITITAVNAGALPSDPLAQNTSQSLVYRWKEMGGWNSNDKGMVEVLSYYIPTGFSVYVKADDNTGSNYKNGVSNGVINLNGNWQRLIYNIKDKSLITRVLTQSVKATDFSKLAIGDYYVTINYRLSY